MEPFLAHFIRTEPQRFAIYDIPAQHETVPHHLDDNLVWKAELFASSTPNISHAHQESRSRMYSPPGALECHMVIGFVPKIWPHYHWNEKCHGQHVIAFWLLTVLLICMSMKPEPMVLFQTDLTPLLLCKHDTKYQVWHQVPNLTVETQVLFWLISWLHDAKAELWPWNVSVWWSWDFDTILWAINGACSTQDIKSYASIWYGLWWNSIRSVRLHLVQYLPFQFSPLRFLYRLIALLNHDWCPLREPT